MKSLSPELSRGCGTPLDIGSTDLNPGRGGIPFPWPNLCPASFFPSSFRPESDFRFYPTRRSAGKFTLFPAGIAKKLAKGDTALSVTLTATSSLVCVFTIP